MIVYDSGNGLYLALQFVDCIQCSDDKRLIGPYDKGRSLS